MQYMYRTKLIVYFEYMYTESETVPRRLYVCAQAT